jgi:tRNA A37 threonylcarbamoyladenosine synthetase subunit TsaC/SUA5/YrdC
MGLRDIQPRQGTAEPETGMTLDREDIDAIADAVVRKLSQRTQQGETDGPLTAVMLASAEDPIAAIRARNKTLKARKGMRCSR